jgi:hypothetical protein
LIVTFEAFIPSRWPATPSTTIKPILLAELIVAVMPLPRVALPVNSTSAIVKGDGGMNKSALLTATPFGVATAILPEPDCGTVMSTLVVLDELTIVSVVLTVTRLLISMGSKFTPVIVTVVPGCAMEGEKPVIAGSPKALAPTVKAVALVAEPAGVVTEIVPVVAPTGTETTSFVALDDATVAAVPLNATVFWLGVALNPVP